jgi:2-methylcitrate dehydratase PrpD
MRSETQFVGEILGRFVAASSWESIPAPMRHEARRALLNYFACALGSAADPVVATAAKVIATESSQHGVTLLGRAQRLEPMPAAFVNAISANLLDYDDTPHRWPPRPSPWPSSAASPAPRCCTP